MERKKSPYICHIFICTNCHNDKDKKSCSEGDSRKIKDILKKKVKECGWKGQVRVSHSGCMGVCKEGPNVMIHPQNIWFSSVRISDVDSILSSISVLI